MLSHSRMSFPDILPQSQYSSFYFMWSSLDEILPTDNHTSIQPPSLLYWRHQHLFVYCVLSRVDKEEEWLTHVQTLLYSVSEIWRQHNCISCNQLSCYHILRVVQCKLTQALICTWLAVSYSMNRTAVHMVRHPKPHKGFVRWLWTSNQ